MVYGLCKRASELDCKQTASTAIVLAALHSCLEARDPSGAILTDAYWRAYTAPPPIEQALWHVMIAATTKEELAAAVRLQQRLAGEHAAGSSCRASVAAAATDVDCLLSEQLLGLQVDASTGELSRIILPPRPPARTIMSH